MARRPDLAYVADLTARLLKAKAEVKRLTAEYEALFLTDSPREAVPRASRSLTTVSRIIEFLNDHVGQGFTSKQVAAELGLSGKEQSVATTLSKLVKRSRIRKQGNDMYTGFDSPIEIDLPTSDGSFLDDTG